MHFTHVKRIAALMICLVLAAGCSKKRTAAQSGTDAPEIAGTSPTGEQVSLSGLKGKLVLVDFWASWCGPCRRANPALVSLYNKYKDKQFQDASGFVVLSVSLDNNADAWKAAIAKDNLNWPYHVSDLKGWESGFAKAYGVDMIPYNFVIDQNGKIVARNLGESELAIFLDKRLQ